MTEPTYLYRCYRRDGKLLYVGATSSLRLRFVQHRHRSGWINQVACTTIKRFATRQEAFAAEGAAIRRGKPLFNVCLSTRDGVAVRIRMPNETYAKLVKHAAAQCRSFSWVLTDLVEQGLQREAQRAPRRQRLQETS